MAGGRRAEFGGRADRSGLSTIIDAARNGGAEALNRLLRVAHVYLGILAVQETPEATTQKFDASDIRQESMIDVARGIHMFQGRSREFFTWLRQIVRTNTIDQHRRHRKSAEREVVDDLLLNNIHAPSDTDQLLHFEQRKQVEKAMSKLSEDHRAVLRLRVWERLKWEEIGQKLNRSADASRLLFARALDAVRGDLGDQGPSAACGA
jgi:RNA polymerase sigma-70 factor (ECF subfamily)